MRSGAFIVFVTEDFSFRSAFEFAQLQHYLFTCPLTGVQSNLTSEKQEVEIYAYNRVLLFPKK